MYQKKIISLFDEAKKLHKQGVPVEIEIRVGHIINNQFRAGVPRSRHKMMLDWLEQSNIHTENWKTSTAFFHGKHERVIVTKNPNSSVSTIDMVEKKPVVQFIMASNHPEGIAIKLCLYTEKPIQLSGHVPGNLVRLRNRKSYILNSKEFNNTFTIDFTQVWQGASERQVKESQRTNKDTLFEIELELINTEYLEAMTSLYLADSFIGKCKSLFQPEMEVGRIIDFYMV